jgi:hypothetical protein
MPDELQRIEMMRGALEVAARDPVPIDAESADTWAERMLEKRAAGTATVLFHSIFWIYPPAEVTERLAATIQAAGARADSEAPLDWLRYEPSADAIGVIELRLHSWPDDTEELLARGEYHWAPVEWLR